MYLYYEVCFGSVYRSFIQICLCCVMRFFLEPVNLGLLIILLGNY